MDPLIIIIYIFSILPSSIIPWREVLWPYSLLMISFDSLRGKSRIQRRIHSVQDPSPNYI